jgi:hypothetical protein
MVIGQPDTSFPYFRRIVVCRFHHSILSDNGVSDKSGAIQLAHINQSWKIGHFLPLVILFNWLSELSK